MYESDAIISYLFNEYGDGSVPTMLKLGAATTITCGLALAPRWVGRAAAAWSRWFWGAGFCLLWGAFWCWD